MSESTEHDGGLCVENRRKREIKDASVFWPG